MSDGDEWADRGRPEDQPQPPRPPQARRVADEWGDRGGEWSDENTSPAPLRRGKGAVVAVVVGALLLVGALGTAIYLVVDAQTPRPPRVAFGPPPGMGGPGFGPGAFGPGMPAPGVPVWQPAADATGRQVRAALRNLGRALQKPDFDPDDHFDIADMVSTADAAIPREPRWGLAVADPFAGQPPAPGAVPPPDPAASLRAMLRNARPQWRKREWEKADVRSVLVTDFGAFQLAAVMVWQRQPDGPPVKRLWTLARLRGGPGGAPGADADEDGGTEWKIRQWEDAVTGMSGTDELALDLVVRAERRYDLYPFQQLPDLHRLIDDGEFEQAEQRLSALARTRPVGRFADLCDLADAKLRLRRGDWFGAAAVLNALVERGWYVLAQYALLAETSNRQGLPDNAVTNCERFLKDNGPDPDVHALLAEALLAKDQPADARPHVTAALKEVPDHPRALDVLRRLAKADPAGDASEFSRRVVRSPTFPDLYRKLSPNLVRDQDWPSLLPLAEEYHARRPDDLDAVRVLIQARAESGDADGALALFLRYAPQGERSARWGLVSALTSAVRTGERAKALYKLLPDDLADDLFSRLVQGVEMTAHGFGGRAPKPEDAVRREVAELVALHATRRPDSPAVRLHEAKALIRDKKWVGAEAKLAGIKTEPNPDGDRDSTAWEVEEARTDVFFALKKWDAAVAGTRGPIRFRNLADRCEEEKQWADLTALLAAARKAGTKLAPGTAEYWSGVALAGQGKHADAVAVFKKVLAVPPPKLPSDLDDEDDYDGPFSRRLMVSRCARSAVKAGQAADAVALLEKEDDVEPVLFAHALAAAGKPERAAKYLLGVAEGNRFFADMAYRDSDFGPVLADKAEFAEFRGRYPKPDDLPKDE